MTVVVVAEFYTSTDILVEFSGRINAVFLLENVLVFCLGQKNWP